MSELQTLVLNLEEDITSFYQQSFIVDRPVKTCPFLFVTSTPGNVDPQDMSLVWTESAEGSVGNSDATVVESVESEVPDKDEDWDDDWVSDVPSSPSSASESEQFHDAVECPECVWFTLEV